MTGGGGVVGNKTLTLILKAIFKIIFVLAQSVL